MYPYSYEGAHTHRLRASACSQTLPVDGGRWTVGQAPLRVPDRPLRATSGSPSCARYFPCTSSCRRCCAELWACGRGILDLIMRPWILVGGEFVERLFIQRKGMYLGVTAPGGSYCGYSCYSSYCTEYGVHKYNRIDYSGRKRSIEPMIWWLNFCVQLISSNICLVSASYLPNIYSDRTRTSVLGSR